MGKLGYKYWPIAKQAVVHVTYILAQNEGPAEQFPEIRQPGRELVFIVVRRQYTGE